MAKPFEVRTYSPHFDLTAPILPTSCDITISHLDSSLIWNTGTDSFSNGFARSDGNLGVGVTGVDPYGAGGKEDLIVGFNGAATISGSASRTVGSLRVGTDMASIFIGGRNGSGTVSVNNSTNLTLSSTTSTGDLIVGEGGYQGTMNWNSAGTLTAQGKLRIGQGGIGVFNQTAGVVIGWRYRRITEIPWRSAPALDRKERTTLMAACFDRAVVLRGPNSDRRWSVMPARVAN